MKLSATAKVILGMLRMRPRSGYEIKSFVDKSTSFFWSASYGRIYPELKRLEQEGLIAGSEEPSGGRARVVHRLTPAGRAALEQWLERGPETLEFRDEGLLQAFLADGPEQASEALAAKAELHRGALERLRRIEPDAAAAENPFPHLVLRYGLALSEFNVAWCEREAARLRAEAGGGSGG